MKKVLTHTDIYEKWLSYTGIDADTKAELESIKNNEDEIKLRFRGNMEFGTAGLRGIMCAGQSCINTYTIAHATQGLANLIIDEDKCERGVAIAYDSRNNSALYAKISASVLCANGIKGYIFDALRPTPELSFAVRELKCIAGINITASHNPKQYNGYKVYWEDGAQLSPVHAGAVSKYIENIDIFEDVKTTDFDCAVKDGRITVVGEELDRAFMKNVLAQAVNPEVVGAVADDLKIVYTPLHGAGHKLVPEALRAIGLKNLVEVPEQMIIDGDFPTVAKPNPELADAFTLGIELAEKVGSDLVVATDPDCDRVGVMSRDKDGKFVRITGNQMGALLLDYIITAYKEKGGVPADAYAVKTIVSTEMVAEICKQNNVKLYNVLTGFKFIGEVIKNSEKTGVGTYLLGFEESYGYLKGTYARDKDAVCASMLIGEMTAYYKKKNMTLSTALDALYEKYGYYREGVEDIYMEGLDGIARRTRIMENLRKNTPVTIGGVKVISVGDYITQTITELASGKTEPTGLPKSDVLRYELENGDIAVVRPSGTEPKIKMYFLASAKTKEALDAQVDKYLSRYTELLCD